MINFDDLHIILLDRNPSMVQAWHDILNPHTDLYPNISTACADIQSYLEIYHNIIGGIVCPANSFGLMDGGWDGAVRNWFLNKYDRDIIPHVQGVIKDIFLGEQPVGSALKVDINTKDGVHTIIHTPSMRMPRKIIDAETVYQCTRACIIEALHSEVDKIIIPAFGGNCGGLDCETIAYYMEAAFRTFAEPPAAYTWNYVNHKHSLSNPLIRGLHV